jgi:hypothetical protein
MNIIFNIFKVKILRDICNLKKTPWPLVREWTLPTERPPLVDEIQYQVFWMEGCRVVSAADPVRSLIYIDGGNIQKALRNKIYLIVNLIALENGVFWVVTPCGSCKNRRFGGTWRLLHQGDKFGELGATQTATSNRRTLRRNTEWLHWISKDFRDLLDLIEPISAY